jgi:hypothetical protein
LTTGGGDLADLIDRGGPEEEGRLVVARVELGQGIVDAWRVADAALGCDVLGAHPEDLLQDELLEDRGVESPIRLGAPCERPIKGRVGSQAQAERLLVVGVHVSEDPDSLGSAGVELVGGDLLDLEQLPESGAEGFLLRRVVG